MQMLFYYHTATNIKNMKLAIPCLLLMIFMGRPQAVKCQSMETFQSIDNYIQKLGSLDSMNIANITEQITAPFSDKTNKSRAIYSWISKNIIISNKKAKAVNPSDELIKIIQTRKSNALNIAALFQEMCSLCGIRCLKIEGYTRIHAKEIGEIPENINHAWNVIQLGNSPDDWHYIDVAKACDYLDEKTNTLTRNFSSSYFFTNPAIFNLDHYPENKMWILGENRFNNKTFFNLPIIGCKAYEINLFRITPDRGFILFPVNQPIVFEFEYQSETPISTIEVTIGEGNKKQPTERINYTDQNGKIRFTYTFKKSLTVPFKILINGQHFLTYQIEISD